MKPVTIYTTRTCGYCRMAKALLARKGAAFQEIDVTFDAALRAEMTARYKAHVDGNAAVKRCVK